MKKHITILFCLIIGFANSQVLKKVRPIEEVEKKILPKTIVLRDSVKNTKKTVVNNQPEPVDTTFVAKGNFKFYKKDAHASYYAEKFTGLKTASGKIFSNNGYTAAHKTLPFGTKLKVTNEQNGKFVVVEVTDRGPFVKSREIDLTKRAFMEITSNKAGGSVIVKIEIMQK
jgi:rare lipoprotein A